MVSKPQNCFELSGNSGIFVRSSAYNVLTSAALMHFGQNFFCFLADSRAHITFRKKHKLFVYFFLSLSRKSEKKLTVAKIREYNIWRCAETDKCQLPSTRRK